MYGIIANNLSTSESGVILWRKRTEGEVRGTRTERRWNCQCGESEETTEQERD